MKYYEYMGLTVEQLRLAIDAIVSNQHRYLDADRRLAFIAVELALLPSKVGHPAAQ